MMDGAFPLLLLLLVSFVTLTSESNILVVHSFTSKSHKIAFDPIVAELVKRGHHVTAATSLKPPDVKQTGIRDVHLNISEQVLAAHSFNFFQGDLSDSNVRNGFLQLVDDMANAFYEESFVRDLILEPRDKLTNEPKYDIVIIDTIFNEYALPLAYTMGVPNLYFSPGALMSSIAWPLNIPYPFSYLPTGISFATGQMSFLQRAQNVFSSMMFVYLRSVVMHSSFDKLIAKHLPNIPPLSVLERNVSFVLENYKLPLIRSAPSMPYYVSVGGLHCRPAKKLPKELEDFFQSSGDFGTIYFSLGSYTKGELMPSEMKDKIVQVFAQLPQKILWKYESDIEDLPKNVKLVKWAPQQDILGHPKLQLFMTHAGAMSLQEACYHGTPILTFPLSADQLGNAATVVTVGIAENIQWRTFTAKELLEKMTRLLNDKSYKENAVKASAIFRDNIGPPVETAAYWIEYVIRHKGAHHLKSGAEHLNFFQYFLLDVIGVIVLISSILLIIFGYVVKKVFQLLFRKSKRADLKKHKKQ